MRGVKSFAMVLCVSAGSVYQSCIAKPSSFQATSKDGKEGGIEIIQPPPNSKPGDRIYFEGSEYEGK
jgi:aminoacyl tRNA synthase complex-interacting multifunctional protein 1